MANEDSVLREVEQELVEERQMAMFRRYGPIAIGLSAAILVGVGGWQFWKTYQANQSKAAAIEFNAALQTLDESPAQGQEALGAIAEDTGTGYGILAGLQRAASFARDGEDVAAIGAYQSIYTDSSVPRQVRDLARVRAAYLGLSDGRDSALGHLGDLANTSGPFFGHATEIVGIGAFIEEDYETALALFRELAINLDVPEPVRERAGEFSALAAAGKSGVNLTGSVQLDDILGVVGGDEVPAIDVPVTLPDEPAASVEQNTDAETTPTSDDTTPEGEVSNDAAPASDSTASETESEAE